MNRKDLLLSVILLATLDLSARHLRGQEIKVDASKVTGRVSRHLTGACIEDVKHEIYGGLYSQMIFGESFQEPELTPPLESFTSFGGHWVVHGGELWADGGDGPKLISDQPAFAAGDVRVQVLFPDNK